MLFNAIAILALAPAIAAGAPGCYPTWQSGGLYYSGSYVSATLSIESPSTTVSGSGAITTTTTAYIKKNFKCISGSEPTLSHCPAYDPSNIIQAANTWADLGECSGITAPATAPPTNKPTFAKWSGWGCPNEWVSGRSYKGGEFAVVDGVVYKCSTTEFVNQWCGQSIYKPGNSLYWEQAWTRLGSCSGTISPTKSPQYVSLTKAGGCPDEFVIGAKYEEGDKVAVNSIVYKCRSWPNAALCSMRGYEPDGLHSADAWTRMGYCEGTILPTSSPFFDKTPDLGGCPRQYSSDNSYEAGDKVSVEGNGLERIVYECKAFQESRFCDQFEPGHSSELGWKLVGYCDGPTMPTTSPSWVKLVDHNGCPEEYSSGTHYESNDKVAVRVNDIESVVYKCSGDIHLSRYCSQLPPGNAYDLGWTLIAHCTGTMSPTSSPNFSQLREIGDGCPRKYNPSTTYEAGDQASVSVSNAAHHSVVYECKSWPDGAFCNAGSYFAPDSVNVNMGWTLKGYCEGTITPTMSPVVYPTSKCSWYNGTKPVIIETWSTNNLALYTAGTRVRKNDRIYRCNEYPYSLWCKMSAYEPEKSQYWTDAWTKAGRCPNISSPSPTKVPTKTPAHATITIFIGGSLTLDVNFTSSGTLSAIQTMKLADSVKAAITNIVCTDKETCNIDILTVNNQTVPRHLRGDVQRLLTQGNIVVTYLIIMEIACLLPDCLDKPVYELFMNVTTLLTNATSTLSFVDNIVASDSFQALQTVLTVTSAVNTITSTKGPSKSPSQAPTTTSIKIPSKSPTKSPAISSNTTPPSLSPSKSPPNTTSPLSQSPSIGPTTSPLKSPTTSPTASPSKSGSTTSPSTSPTEAPSTSPSTSPSIAPTTSPSKSPTKSPFSTSPPSTSPTTSPTASPSKSGSTASPSTSPTEAPSTSPSTFTPSPTDCIMIDISITFDCCPSETYWVVTVGNAAEISLNDTVIVADSPHYSCSTQNTTSQVCLPGDGQYTFAIYDQARDGLCCGYGNGGYVVTSVDDPIVTIAEGGEFNFLDVTTFSVPIMTAP